MLFRKAANIIVLIRLRDLKTLVVSVPISLLIYFYCGPILGKLYIL